MADFVRSLGLQLVDRGSKPFDTQQLSSSDVIAFYFSAHWCPPCRQFTPVLKKFFEALQATGDLSLKVIFVSSDKSESEMWQYMYEAHGNWLAVSYGSGDRDKLSMRYEVRGIPSLVVINQVGQSVVPNAVQQVFQASQYSAQIFKTYYEWRTASGAAPAAPPPSQLPAGTKVKVRGLVNKPELNGEQGSVRSLNREKQRYDVELGDSVLALRAQNLLQLVAVSMPGDAGDAEVVDFDDESGELVLRQGSEEPPVLSRARLIDEAGPILKEGTYVVVQGLKAESAKQWNECLAKVVSYSLENGRYLVEVAPGAQKSIKPDNLRLCPLV